MSDELRDTDDPNDELDDQPQATRRASEEDVRRLVEGHLPSPELRHLVLSFLAELIDIAHAAGADCWAITVREGRLRFAAGIYAIFDIDSRGVSVLLKRSVLKPESLPILEQQTTWDTWKSKSDPDAITSSILFNRFSELFPLVHEATLMLTRAAVSSARRVNSNSLAAHCAGAVQYLRTELGQAVPEPFYGVMEGIAGSFASVDRPAIEAACARFDAERRTTSTWQRWEQDQTYRYVISWNGQRYPVKEIVRIATGTTNFNSNQARRLLSQLGFSVETLHDTAQRVWLFQANPRFYNLAERVQASPAGSDDDWTVTRYREEMRPGDQVLLWQAGAEAGIYALGTITAPPAEHTYAPDEVPAWLTTTPDTSPTVWRVAFQYTQVLPEPLRRATLLEHPLLQRMQVLRTPNGTNFRVSSEEWDALQDILERAPASAPPAHERPAYSMADCARDTGIAEAELARWLRALARKKQAVLYGPPGTGKTFVAQRLARHLVGGGEGLVELVQFHPAYTYEDFIQGIRPASDAGALSYPLVPGRFLDFCARARAVTDTCVLIIDEINRANLARVFGELMYLLEYRDQSLPLAGGGVLSIPENVRIIGTMNTADRSIALVDHALRRRFAFLPLQPNYDVLRRFQLDYGTHVEGLIATLEQVNRAIGDASYAVGISYFMRPQLALELEDIWRMEIEPYLEEYFFDRRESFERFRWERIAASVQP